MRLDDPHEAERVLYSGHDLGSARSAFIMLHGRGASARDILSVGQQLATVQTAIIAPQAAENSWYPYSFLAPVEQNQPWLDSALHKIAACIEECRRAGIERERIAIIGFSQGACLATEFVARHPIRYGAVIAFTGGLLGPLGDSLEHPGSMEGTPILLTSGEPDLHVPWRRVEESAEALSRMGAIVQLVRNQNRPHTILNSELRVAKELLLSSFLLPA